jgi:chromosome segregation protein
MSAQLDRRVGEGAEEERRLAEARSGARSRRTEARERQEANLRAREQHAVEREAAAAAAAEAIARAEGGEEGTRAARSVLDAAREARFEAEMAETKVHSDLEHLTTQAREEFGVEPGELPPPTDVSDEALALLEAETAELSAAIERIGPVNVLAVEEYAEETRRSTFLTAQRDDLLRSIAELQDSIRKINATSSERFREAFRPSTKTSSRCSPACSRGGPPRCGFWTRTICWNPAWRSARSRPGRGTNPSFCFPAAKRR